MTNQSEIFIANGEIFWNTFNAELTKNEKDIPRKHETWHFCNDEASANHLAELVYRGEKVATASLYWSYEAEGSPVPKAGDYSIITLWDETPVCVIETTQVEVIPFDEVTADFAAAEGEGDMSLDYWRKVHLVFFSEECAAINRNVDPKMPVVCERFNVVFRNTGLF